jgi:hypothetical protein
VPVSDVFLVRITGRIVPIGPPSFHSYGLFNDTQFCELLVLNAGLLVNWQGCSVSGAVPAVVESN